jgi:hypothetical protein
VTEEETLGGFVLDASALAALGAGANIYATTWADHAAQRGIVLLVPAAACPRRGSRFAATDPAMPIRCVTCSPRQWS